MWVPLKIIHFDRKFHEINQPAIGDPPIYGTPLKFCIFQHISAYLSIQQPKRTKLVLSEHDFVQHVWQTSFNDKSQSNDDKI